MYRWLRYYRRLVWVATRDSAHIVRTELLTDGILLVAAIVVAALWFVAAGASFSAQSTYIAVVSFMAVIGGVFTWSLMWAPVNLERDARMAADETQERLADLRAATLFESDPEQIADDISSQRAKEIPDGYPRSKPEFKSQLLLRHALDLAGAGIRPHQYNVDQYLYDMDAFWGDMVLIGVVAPKSERSVDDDGSSRTMPVFHLTELGTRVVRLLQRTAKGDEIDKIIKTLQAEKITVWESGVRTQETLLSIFEDCDSRLAAGGIRPSEWEGKFLYNMNHNSLIAALARFRVLGLVDVRRRTVERDRGYPYTEEDFYLSDLGAQALRRIERNNAREYGED